MIELKMILQFGDGQMDKRTDGQTLVVVKSLSRLKKPFIIKIIKKFLEKEIIAHCTVFDIWIPKMN